MPERRAGGVENGSVMRPGRQPIQPGFSWHNFFGLFFGTKKIQAEKVAQLFQANDAPAAGLEAGWPAGRHGGARFARANRIQVPSIIL